MSAEMREQEQRVIEAVKMATDQSDGKTIVCYDVEREAPYFRHPDGRRQYDSADPSY